MTEVDRGAYPAANAEVRARSGRTLRATIPTGRDLQCECIAQGGGGAACAAVVKFQEAIAEPIADMIGRAFEEAQAGIAGRDVLAVHKDYGNAIASARRGTLRATATADGARIEADLPAGRVGDDVVAASETAGIVARPLIDYDSPETKFTDTHTGRVVESAHVRAILFAIEVEGGAVMLRPAGSWDVRGPWRESEWWYRVDLFGPSGNITRFLPAASVVHFRYAVDPARPWYGISPLGWARSTGTLAANLETRLGEETGAPVGHVLAVPQDGGDGGDEDPLAQFKAVLAGAKGRTVVAETTAAGWGEGKMAAPQADYKAHRFGAAPPDSLPSLRSDAALSVLSACGVPVSLATDADGTSQREAWRRFVMGAVEPLLAIVGQEVAAKLETGVTFDLSSLWAHDLAGRAAAFKSFVGNGATFESAAAECGLTRLVAASAGAPAGDG